LTDEDGRWVGGVEERKGEENKTMNNRKEVRGEG